MKRAIIFSVILALFCAILMVPATGHSWDKGKVTKEPTATADGTKTFTCKSCGKTKTEPILKTVETKHDNTSKPTGNKISKGKSEKDKYPIENEPTTSEVETVPPPEKSSGISIGTVLLIAVPTMLVGAGAATGIVLFIKRKSRE